MQDSDKEFHLLFKKLLIIYIPVPPTMSPNFLAESWLSQEWHNFLRSQINLNDGMKLSGLFPKARIEEKWERHIQYQELPLVGKSARCDQLICCNKERCNLLSIIFVLCFLLDVFLTYAHVTGLDRILLKQVFQLAFFNYKSCNYIVNKSGMC